MCKQCLKEKLGKEAVFISLTTDRYIDKHSHRNLHHYTAHYINHSWVLQAFVLETLPFPEWYTGINVAQKLKEVLEKYEIVDTVRMVSHDQGSNMKTAMDDELTHIVLLTAFNSAF